MDIMIPWFYKIPTYVTVLIALIVGNLCWRTKKIDDILLFLGFCLLAILGLLNLHFGLEFSVDNNMNVIETSKPLLSRNASVIIQFVSYITITIGFLIKLIENVKKT